MIDGRYMKSLISTIVAYAVIVGALAAFVYATGVAGVSLILVIIILLLCYFYGCFSLTDSRKKGRRS
jgi:apolipoprotein N-acyltransferase